MNDDERSRRAVLGTTGAVIGGSLFAAGSAQAQTGANFWVEELSGVPDSSTCNHPVSVAAVIRNRGDSAGTRTIKLKAGYNNNETTQDSVRETLQPGEETPVHMETDDATQNGDFVVLVDTGDDELGQAVEIDDCNDDGCFLTTATYNDVRTLNSLRRFRDDSMSATPVGRGLVGLYYRISPPIADTLERHPDSRTANTVRGLVQRCAALSDKQSETHSRVKSAMLGVYLTMLYIVGILVAAAGHGAIRAGELASD